MGALDLIEGPALCGVGLGVLGRLSGVCSSSVRERGSVAAAGWLGLPAGLGGSNFDEAGEFWVEGDLSHVGFAVVVGVDVERFEGCEVQRGPLVFVTDCVEAVGLFQDLEANVEVFSDFVVACLCAGDQAPGVSQFLVDGFLSGT